MLFPFFISLFVENIGQYDEQISFYSTGNPPVVILENGKIMVDGITISMGKEPSSIRGYLMENPTFSYFGEGKEFTDIPVYRGVILSGIYDNVDAILLSIDGKMEMEFVVHPGGNPDIISIRVEGGRMVEKDGVLYVQRGAEKLLKISRFHAYQGAEELPLHVNHDGNRVTFKVEHFDRSHDLIIDPIVVAFPASEEDDYGYAVAVDNEGYVYVAGYTDSPSTFAPERTIFGDSGRSDVFITRLSPDLSNHIATAIVASSCRDYARDMALDSAGNVVIVGWTGCSSSFAPDRTIMGTPGENDVFVTKLSGDLNVHLGTVILASQSYDYAYGVHVAPDGRVLVAGYTYDQSTFAPRRTIFGTPGSYDAFVSLLSSDLSNHIATAIVASPGMDNGQDVAVDDSGNVYLVGFTWGTSSFAPDRAIFGNPGGQDVFVSRLSTDLSAHLNTAIIASSGTDDGVDIFISDSSVYISGFTDSPSDYSSDRLIFGNTGGEDAFVSRLTRDLNTHLSSVILASSGSDCGCAMNMDTGGILLSGYVEFPDDLPQPLEVHGITGGLDAFLIKLSPGLSYYVKGIIIASDSEDIAWSIATGDSGVYIAGRTASSSSFAGGGPIFGASGGMDAFVVRAVNALKHQENIARSKHSVRLRGNILQIKLSRAGYVGFDIYSSDGRVVFRKSVGILPSGIYSFPLNLNTETYIVKLRIDNRLSIHRMIIVLHAD